MEPPAARVIVVTEAAGAGLSVHEDILAAPPFRAGPRSRKWIFRGRATWSARPRTLYLVGGRRAVPETDAKFHVDNAAADHGAAAKPNRPAIAAQARLI